jgi:signal transduction histidine kinase/DNA-binding response OmpR family regulator
LRTLRFTDRQLQHQKVHRLFDFFCVGLERSRDRFLRINPLRYYKSVRPGVCRERVLSVLLFAAFLHAAFGQKSPPVLSNENFLLEYVRAHVATLPVSESACPYDAFKHGVDGAEPSFDMEVWATAVEKMRNEGNRSCCFQLLTLPAAKAEHDPELRFRRLYEKIQSLRKFEMQDSALVLAKQLVAEADAVGRFQGWAYLAEAQLHRAKRRFYEANTMADKALNYARANQDRKLEAQTLSLLGTVNRDVYMNIPEKFAPYHLQAIQIAEALKDTALIVSEYLALVYAYDETRETDKQYEYLRQALAYFKPHFSLTLRASIIRTAAVLAQNLKYSDYAKELYLAAIALQKKLGIRSTTQNNYEHLSDIYFAENKLDAALAAMDSASAYSNFKAELGYFYLTYAKIYEAKGDTAKAFAYYNKAFDEQVKGYTNRNTQQLTEWETRFQTKEKALELAHHQQLTRVYLALILVLSILSFAALFFVFKQKQYSKKLSVQKATIEKQAVELLRLDEMKSRFFANVSHELRTPLTLILGPLSSLLKSGDLSGRNFTEATLAQQNSKTLLKLVNEILDLSKLEAGKMQLNETTVSFSPFLRRIVSAFESYAGQKGVELRFENKLHRWLQLSVDEDKITKVLNNLLSNALKFTSRGGFVSVSAEDMDHCIRVSVRDTGRGIDGADLPNIFDRFYQTGQAGAPAEGGTGIGLALCRELATLMKGKVWAESTPGVGSVFYFEFPKHEVLGAAPDVAEVLDRRQEPEFVLFSDHSPADLPAQKTLTRVLVVEDNPSLCAYLKLILSERYSVKTAENGLEALEILEKSEIQLIVSDIMMPGMDGFQLLEKLKNDDRYRHIPVIMLTARADIADKLKALRIGVDDYMLKPFDEEELIARTENLCANLRTRKQEIEPEQPELNQHSLRIQAAEYTWLSALEKVVAENLKHPDLTVETLADQLAMSRTQFFREVKRLTGLTPAQYIDEARFRQARMQLEGGQLDSVKAAAYNAGFRQVEHFSRQFKQRFGKYPSEYLAV